MIILYAYLLSCLIFAIAMVVEAVRSEHFKIQENSERFIGIVAVFTLSFALYPMMIAAELQYIEINSTHFTEYESQA